MEEAGGSPRHRFLLDVHGRCDIFSPEPTATSHSANNLGIPHFASFNITPGKFITFFYCLLDAKNKKLVYTNADHNRPILFHQDGSWIELKEGGLALGMSRERNYEQGEIELSSGDRLLLFTDGVTEVMNAEREEFGEEWLIGLLMNNRDLGAVELQKRVMTTVTTFCGSDFQDDVTMVVIGVE